MTGCGPQENWDEHKRMPFYIALEAEIVKGELAGKTVIIEMDANAKLGPEYIAKDTHEMSGNGKILASIIERHVLSVANESSRCTGSITNKDSPNTEQKGVVSTWLYSVVTSMTVLSLFILIKNANMCLQEFKVRRLASSLKKVTIMYY